MITALLAQSGITQAKAAVLCGVSTRTMQNWIGGKTRVPAVALETLTAAAEAAWMRDEADIVGTIETADPPSMDERIGMLRYAQAVQQRNVARLTDELASEQQALDETTQRLNALRAERGRNETMKGE